MYFNQILATFSKKLNDYSYLSNQEKELRDKIEELKKSYLKMSDVLSYHQMAQLHDMNLEIKKKFIKGTDLLDEIENLRLMIIESMKELGVPAFQTVIDSGSSTIYRLTEDGGLLAERG